jgi:hypothetical protein
VFKIAEDLADCSKEVSNKTVHTGTRLFQARILTLLIPKKALNTKDKETKSDITFLTK